MSEAQSPALNPWRPIRDATDLKHLGKLGEELAEAGAAVSRCIIQGVDEREPVSGKLNREWLEDEIADVMANLTLVMQRFDLDVARIMERRRKKIAGLATWHAMTEPSDGP
jgi:NTP pyrophosphatase (non-canonical NTP hydrolase)